MLMVFLAALGVGGATVIGGVIGFFIKKTPKRFFDLTISFAAGIMLAAAVWGLLVPSMGEAGLGEVVVTVAGLLAGALLIGVCERMLPSLRFVTGDKAGNEVDGAIKLLLAMAVHNLPEGIAAGVSFGSGDVGSALSVAGGIALQNLPEGMVIIPPMLAAGISRRRAFLLAAFTGLTEIVGTFIGYKAVVFFGGILSFSLAFAGGAMIYVIADEMMPRAREQGRLGVYSFVVGICTMLFLNTAI